MGSSSSKFRKYLQHGDEVAALNVYNNHSDLRKGLDPNSSYGDNYQHETPLHLAARHGMKSLLRIFLFEHGGNPNKTNGRKETALHCVCMEKNPQYYPVQKRRVECLNLMLQWRGAQLKDGDIEKVDLSALDELNNTALHYAAQSGLKSCVEILVNHSCPLFIENNENQTPCDSAEASGYNEIALYLESKMVFSNDGNSGEVDEVPPEVDSEEYSGLRAQDLQEAKDQLLVETADMLSIPLFTAEALLRNHEWSREMLLDAWMSNPVACCEKSGVTPPANLFSEKPVVAESLSTPTLTNPPSCFAECDICTQHFQLDEEPVHMSCHQFCRGCWEGYLNVKIQEGGVHDITCPGFECSILVPVEVIENVVSRDMARRYLQFDIKAFVDSNPNIKWCPFPGCGRAVKLPEVVENTSSSSAASPRHSKIPNDTSRAVDCGNGHYFCWECLGEAHEPCSCDSLTKWKGEIAEIKPETLHDTEQKTESAANCLWLVTNSKACPNCKSPIQKNEGCNHMKCSKCKYDFCWVCLDQWKRHNSSTGGYFKCNRYEVSKKVDDTAKVAQTEAEDKNSKLQELNKFVHYYTRYKNHENSYKLEEPLLKTAKDKMMKLAEAVTDIATAKGETKFVEEAIHKLLKARRVLKYSYVYGYYLDGPPYRKIVFEFMQTELEECTEILSQMVNRLYLRTPRKKIIEQSQVCHRKRQEFLTAISKGLVPPETPPGLRKKRRKYSMDTEDEDLKKAILASIEDFDPSNPWIVDASGRHTNVAAMLDWPSDDSSDEDSPARRSPNAPIEPCEREGCSRSRAKNPRTGEYHTFCSMRCSKLHKQRKDEPDISSISEIQLDEHMDFLRALEMSRLQFLKEQSSQSQENREDERPVSQVTASQAMYDEEYTPAERLDIEIKRLLEISSLTPDDEDKAKQSEEEEQLDDQSISGGDDKPVSLSRFGENQSSVVSRVPNKSVEDLYHPDCSGCQGATGLSPLMTEKFSHQGEPSETQDLAGDGLVTVHSESKDTSEAGLRQVASDPQLEHGQFQLDDTNLEALGACGGVDHGSPMKVNESLDDFRVEGRILQKMLNMDNIEKNVQEPTQSNISPSGTSFGVIKDLSVSNIHVEDQDKMKNFSAKDFSNLSKSKPRVVERGNGRLFAANTPGDDEKVFTLLSPESDFSESSSSEVWGFRPQLVHEPLPTQTPETDSSIDGCSYADLPNQNMYYRHGDSTNEASPVIGDETKLMNLVTHSGDAPADQMSIMEMTKNLLQMTVDMQAKTQAYQKTKTRLSAQNSEEILPTGACDVIAVSNATEAEIKQTDAHSGKPASQSTSDDTLPSSQDHISAPKGNVTDISSKDCEAVDLDTQAALTGQEVDKVTMTTVEKRNSGSGPGETTNDESRDTTHSGDARSTFV